MYPEHKLYGPYTRKDGRQIVLLYFTDGTKTTVSYPKFLVEQALGQRIPLGYHIHHKDGDFTNNHLSNLDVLSHSEHARLHYKDGNLDPRKGIERGWKHGTTYGWMKKKCNCEECKAAKYIFHDKRNKARRSPNSKGYNVKRD